MAGWRGTSQIQLVCEEVDGTTQSRRRYPKTATQSHPPQVSECFRRAPRPEDIIQELCEFCASIDFEAIFSSIHEWGSSSGSLLLLPLRRPSLGHESCQLCKIFRFMILDGLGLQQPHKYQYRLRVQSSTHYAGARHHAPSPYYIRYGCGRPFQQPSTLEYGILLTANWRSIDMPAPSIRANEDWIRYPRANLTRMASELRFCVDQYHASSCVDSIVEGMHLIDCRTKMIVLADPAMRYLALSYVWGHSHLDNGHHQFDTRRPIEHLPQTILDALDLTSRLGYHYLWVDRYCIDQKDGVRKRQQIDKMGDIFHSCVATIIALGEDDTTGLPGISVDRASPMTAQVSICDVVADGPRLRHAIRASRWNSRAWCL